MNIKRWTQPFYLLSKVTPMSIKVMSYIWEHSPHKGSELITLLAIADYADDRGIAYPSIAALSKKTRMTERNVDHVLKKLVKRQALSIARQAGPNRSNIFTVHFPTSKIRHGENFSPPIDEKFSPSVDEKFSPSTEKVVSKKSMRSSRREPDMVKTFQGVMVKTSAEEMTPVFTPTIIRDPSEELTPSVSTTVLTSPQGDEGAARDESVAKKVKVPATSKPSRRCPVEYAPDDGVRSWAAEEFPDVDFKEALAEMRDHQFKDGKTDWDATLRNWIREKHRRQGYTSAQPPQRRTNGPPYPVRDFVAEQRAQRTQRGRRFIEGAPDGGHHAAARGVLDRDGTFIDDVEYHRE